MYGDNMKTTINEEKPTEKIETIIKRYVIERQQIKKKSKYMIEQTEVRKKKIFNTMDNAGEQKKKHMKKLSNQIEIATMDKDTEKLKNILNRMKI